MFCMKIIAQSLLDIRWSTSSRLAPRDWMHYTHTRSWALCAGLIAAVQTKADTRRSKGFSIRIYCSIYSECRCSWVLSCESVMQVWQGRQFSKPGDFRSEKRGTDSRIGRCSRVICIRDIANALSDICWQDKLSTWNMRWNIQDW